MFSFKNFTMLFSCLLLACVSIAKGDAKLGKFKSASCASCHGPKGMSPNPLWPNLAGQKAKYLERQLVAFKLGKRKDPSMESMAAPLTLKDIQDISAFYSSLK